MLAAVSAVGLLLSPAVAAPAKRKAPAVAVSFDPLSTFTPGGADPKLAAYPWVRRCTCGLVMLWVEMTTTCAPSEARRRIVQVA